MIEINLQPLDRRGLKLLAGRIRARDHRAANRDAILARDRACSKKNRPKKYRESKRFRDKRMVEAAVLKQAPCADCGDRFPTCAMDWDHREGEAKVDGVGRLTVRPKAVMLAEIAKCDVVCACCHRIRTAKRLGSPTADRWWP